MTTSPTYVLRSGILTTEGDGRYYATDTHTGAIFELNQTGWRIVSAMNRPAEVSALVARLVRAYPDVPAQDIQADVHGLLADLIRIHFVEQLVG